MSDQILVIDEGTSSTRAMRFDRSGNCRASAQRPILSTFPQPGWVEQDAAVIWDLTLAAAREAIGGEVGRIAAIGITNQRETIVFWDRRTGQPLAPAIVWQDRRTADACARLKADGHEPLVQRKTGLLLDPYFSASKIAWALANWPALRDAGEHLCVGTIDSWLVFKLTGGLHVTDATNASRTALMALRGGWDEQLLDLFGVPRFILPEIVHSAGEIGRALPDHFGAALPICGIAGDQQAAAIGQACLSPGETKATFGTGAFVLTQAGGEPPISTHRLLGTVAWQVAGERTYALEGSSFVAGRMIQWLRDELGLIATSADSEAAALAVASSGGVQIVPAFAGLGAPHWKPEARAAILGLTLGSGRGEIVRAALEAVVNQAQELQRAFAADGVSWSRVRVDGGMADNGFFVHDLANLLGIIVERPAMVESSALGAAMLAGVGCGWFGSLREAANMRGQVEVIEPAMEAEDRAVRIASWDKAVSAVVGMVPRDGIEPPTP